MINYSIGDFLIQLKNAGLAKRKGVTVPKTKIIKEVAKVLKEEGFVDSIEESGNTVIVNLKYKNKEPILMDVKLVSKPGLRRYMGIKEIGGRKNKYAILILSTPKGILSSKKAEKFKVGGEVIAEIN
jgi:small subunit ribosomal protein S8